MSAEDSRGTARLIVPSERTHDEMTARQPTGARDASTDGPRR